MFNVGKKISTNLWVLDALSTLEVGEVEQRMLISTY